MPTPQSSSAFIKLIEAGAYLHDILEELTIAVLRRGTVVGEQNYLELEKEMEAAFLAFKLATEEFSEVVQRACVERQGKTRQKRPVIGSADLY